jgi:hypothetical protein
VKAYSKKKSPRPLVDRGQARKRKRTIADSEHPLFPTCDGQPWRNSPELDARQQAKREFLEAYFRINRAYARLVALRKRHRRKVPGVQEHAIIKEIERRIVAREKLEDLYAPRGVFVTPAYRDGFTVDLRFCDGRNDRPKGSIVVSSASVRITIPLPPGFNAERAEANS